MTDDPLELSGSPARLRLYTELVLLRKVWADFHYLFDAPPERLQLYRCAPYFFDWVKRSMVGQIVLRVSRLTDPAIQQGKQNLTLSVLLDDARLETSSGLRAQVEHAIAKIRADAEPIRRHRNKDVAHIDYAFAMQEVGSELPKLPRALVEGCLTEMEAVYNRISALVYHKHSDFELGAIGDTRSLVIHLEKAQRWEAEEVTRMRLKHRSPPIEGVS